MSQLGIASISTVGVASNINLGNGNTQPLSATFTRTNGQTGTAGTTVLTDGQSGSLILASNPFYREFTDNPVLTTASKALPQMQGSGWVRDLREAMSLGTPQATALQTQVEAFAAASTHDAQMARVDMVWK